MAKGYFGVPKIRALSDGGIFAEVNLPFNVSGLFYREIGGALISGGQQASERRDP
jgi:hypothetical protein